MDIDQVKKLAYLARLTVPEAELALFAKDINAIIGFIDRVRTVTLDSIPDTAGNAVNVLRDDVVLPLASSYDLVECAPLHQDHFVKVLKVIE